MPLLLDPADPVRTLVIAGWTGRDPVARDHHIRELAALGVAPPASTPVYYRVAASRLTTAGRIEASGPDSSGEAEAILLRRAGRLWVGLGSDHTDRRVETYGVTVSKQMCDKPAAPDLWPFDEVANDWDRLELRSWAVIDGARTLYQEGTLAAMLPPATLLAGLDRGLPDGGAMFCGTLPAIGGVRPADRFEMELLDPVRSRRLSHAYDVHVLPIAG